MEHLYPKFRILVKEEAKRKLRETQRVELELIERTT